MIEVSPECFEDMVTDALDKIPDAFVARMKNLAILIEDFHEESPHILGLYEGVALTERTFDHTGFLPDAIFIYRGALQQMCSSEEELRHQVEITVFHELGHYFGLDDAELHRLGWG
ncbi:MAG: metallopeptidase family protein [Corynebacterium sp.]|nr:metallopeptidase family protein [Corynebacterium sp.]